MASHLANSNRLTSGALAGAGTPHRHRVGDTVVRYRHRQGGFTLLGLLILLVILGITATATVQTQGLLQRRAAEQELLAVGAEFAAALASYAAATPAGQPDAPQALEDLLGDKRSPVPLRHLRRLYPDPVTGEVAWGTTISPENQRIVGVYSLSAAQPIKTANFDPPFERFADSKHYYDWVFGPVPPAAPAVIKPTS